MTTHSNLEWHHLDRLLGERDRLRDLLEDSRAAAMSRSDYEPHDVTEDEATIQADAIEGRLAAIDEALDRFNLGGYGLCLVCAR